MKDLIKFLKDFGEERLPEKVGWPNVLGSGILFLIILQIVTGVLLGFNYSPSEEAYESVAYISELKFGRILRGIHFWSANLIVILLILHLARTFLWGAYKKPRQWTWVVGLLLLMVIFAFEFTGYLLPYDQTSYWATTVATKIASTIPIFGEGIKRFLRGGEEVGGHTVSNFFLIHIGLLPLILIPLIIAHIYLLRKHKITPPWSPVGQEDVVREIPFFPHQFFKDVAFSFFLLLMIFSLIFIYGVPLGEKANPLDKDFIPRPEWYFLPIFEILKLKVFSGREWIPAVLLPGIIIAILILLPFFDRNPFREIKKRKISVTVFSGVLALLVGLGFIAHIQTPEPEPPKFRGEMAEGYNTFVSHRCSNCHSIGKPEDKEKYLAPYLIEGKNTRDEKWLKKFVLDPKRVYPYTEMPETIMSEEELDKLVAFVSKFEFVKEKEEEEVFISAKRCASCHKKQYEEWEKSYHHKWRTLPTYRAMFTIYHYQRGGRDYELCLNCHAPETKVKPERVNVLAQQILEGKELQTEGISCVTCHAMKEFEPTQSPYLDGVSWDFTRVEEHLENPDKRKPMTNWIKTEQLCAVCHDYRIPRIISIPEDDLTERVYEEKISKTGVLCCSTATDLVRFGFKGKKTCSTCHMYTEEDSLKPHLWEGARSPDFVRRGIKLSLEARKENGRLKGYVKIHNHAAHTIPNGCPPRSRIILRITLEEDGNVIDSKSYEYGWDLIGLGGARPSMVDNAFDRADFALKPGDNYAYFDFSSIQRGKIKATLSYAFFVPPPPEAKDRMQKMIIKKIKMSDEEGKRKILEEEIPARMNAMNMLETTFPPYVIGSVEKEVR